MSNEQSNDTTTPAGKALTVSTGYLWESPDGKYALRKSKDGVLWADRYGEPWRNLVGDNLIAAMLYTIEELSSDNGKVNHGEE